MGELVQFVPGMIKPGTKLPVPKRVFLLMPEGFVVVDPEDADTAPAEYCAPESDPA